MRGRATFRFLGVVVLQCALVTVPSVLANFKRPEEVPFTEKDENGDPYVFTLAGANWTVTRSEQHDRVYYTNKATGESIWEDPRTLPLTEEEKAAMPAEKRAAIEREEAYAKQQRELMAKKGILGDRSLSLFDPSTTVVFVAVAPVVLFAGILAARIWYLLTYCPELLFPTKERKAKSAKSTKYKPQKARGKMSQDGKGGRSANS